MQRRGTARTLPNFCVVLCIVCFRTFSVLYVCICVLYYCHRVATQLQLNISYHISFVPQGWGMWDGLSWLRIQSSSGLQQPGCGSVPRKSRRFVHSPSNPQLIMPHCSIELDGQIEPHRGFCGSFRSPGSGPSVCPSVLKTETEAFCARRLYTVCLPNFTASYLRMP